MLLLTPALGSSPCLSAGGDSQPLSILLDTLHKQIYLHFNFVRETGLNQFFWTLIDYIHMTYSVQKISRRAVRCGKYLLFLHVKLSK